MKKDCSFEKLQAKRKKFIKENNKSDHMILSGNSKVLLSAPHGVSQIRLGRYKVSEIGSLATAIYLKDKTDCFLIAKTKNNNDDANFDEVSCYKNSMKKLILENDIKYVVDLHGLAKKRECDINLGTHLGNNIENNVQAFEKLTKMLTQKGFKVFVDQPFMAGSRTISGYIKKEFPKVWTLQMEINCGITNDKENFDRYKLLLEALEEWIKSLK